MNVSPSLPTTSTPSTYRLRMPGPAAVPGRVRAAVALPVLSHRGPEFRAILDDVTGALRAATSPEFGAVTARNRVDLVLAARDWRHARACCEFAEERLEAFDRAGGYGAAAF